MAGTADFSQVSVALEQNYRKRIVRQQNRSDIFASLLRKVPGSGKNVGYDVSLGTDTGQVFDDGQVISVFNNDVEIPGTLQWGEYGDTFKITGRAEDAAAGSNTDLGNLFMKKLMDCGMRGAEKLNTDCISGDGTGSPQKLLGVLTAAGPLDSTGTYAGISRSTYAQWAGNVLGNSGIPRAVSLSLLETALDNIFTAHGGAPTYGITTPTIWSALAQLVNDNRRVNQEVYIRGEKLTISMGYHTVEVNGIPIFRDKSWAVGTLAFINDAYIDLTYLPVAQSRLQRGQKFLGMVPMSGTPGEMALSDYGKLPEGAGVPLMAALIELPFVGDASQYMLKATCALTCNKPNAHALIKDLTT